MSQYYQSILQLRNPDDEVETFVYQRIMASSHKGISLSKIKKVRNGIDYYLSSNTFAIHLGRELERKFGGYLKVSEKLHSKDRQTSKDLYRVNVFYKPLSVRIGDVVRHEGSVIRITGIGKKISGIDIATGKKQLIGFRKGEPESLEIEATTVTKIYPSIEVISPETYESIRLEGAKGRNLSIGEKVKVSVDRGKAYLVK